MSQGSRSRLAVTFFAGSLFGVLGGVFLGALLGHRVIAGTVHALAVLARRDKDELRFDLLLQ